jgi:hypothetical protein
MMHVEGYYSTKSLAFKNKNPGNIEHIDGTLKVYSTSQDGFDALVDDISANAGTPLEKFIAKYAPPNENNTSTYLQVVSQLSGICENEDL